MNVGFHFCWLERNQEVSDREDFSTAVSRLQIGIKITTAEYKCTIAMDSLQIQWWRLWHCWISSTQRDQRWKRRNKERPALARPDAHNRRKAVAPHNFRTPLVRLRSASWCPCFGLALSAWHSPAVPAFNRNFQDFSYFFFGDFNGFLWGTLPLPTLRLRGAREAQARLAALDADTSGSLRRPLAGALRSALARPAL